MIGPWGRGAVWGRDAVGPWALGPGGPLAVTPGGLAASRPLGASVKPFRLEPLRLWCDP
ncbi:MAG: hypothetical protein QOC97_306, partial [Chloroflexota bacterium]|nr:hypothetical protein [Chloroflexota bacterium]